MCDISINLPLVRLWSRAALYMKDKEERATGRRDAAPKRRRPEIAFAAPVLWRLNCD